MDDPTKSPLIRGKPAWHVGRRRLTTVLMLVICPLIFIFAFVADSDDLLNFPGWVSVVVALGFLSVVYYAIDVYMKPYGLGFLQKDATLLERLEGVPCPSCLYPLCELEKADAEHVCSECGCGINGVDAIRAWDGLKGYRSPQGWNRWLKDS